MRKPKMRNTDYSLDELAKWTGIERKAFTDQLKRVCEIYGMDYEDFKLYKGEDDSSYFFTPETAELVGILVKNIKKHPEYKRTAKSINVEGSKIADFYSALLKDVDGLVSEEVKKLIYCSQGHFTTMRVADWSDELILQLKRFIVNVSTLETEEVGAAVSLFAKELDKMNYNMYSANELKIEIINSNLGDTEVTPVQRAMNELNVGVDTVIVELLKAFMEKSEEDKLCGYPTLYEKLYKLKGLYLMMGVKDLGIEKAIEYLSNATTDEQAREVYRQVFMFDEEADAKFKHQDFIIKHYRDRIKDWKATENRVPERDSLTVEENQERESIRKEIIEHEQRINELKARLDKLNDKETIAKYKKYCDDIDSKYEEMEEVADKIVGQALYQFLK